MNKLKLKINHFPYQELQRLSFGILLGTLVILNTACSSHGHRKDSMKDVLVHQTDLLTKLEHERREAKVLRKIRQDETLWQAEVHLREAIKALKESTEVVKSAL